MRGEEEKPEAESRLRKRSVSDSTEERDVFIAAGKMLMCDFILVKFPHDGLFDLVCFCVTAAPVLCLSVNL